MNLIQSVLIAVFLLTGIYAPASNACWFTESLPDPHTSIFLTVGSAWAF